MTSQLPGRPADEGPNDADAGAAGSLPVIRATGGPASPADPASTADLESADDFDDDQDDDDDDGDGDDPADPFAALGALFGGAGGANPLAGLLEQAQHMQEDLQDAQRRLADQLVSGSSGGGLVRATVTGAGELQALRIDPSVVDPADVDTLVDLIIAAVRAATSEARTLGDRLMAGAVPDFSGLTGSGGSGSESGFGPGFGGVPGLGAVPDFGTLPPFAGFPGLGPLAGPAGDDPDDDDIGPAGVPRA